MAELLAAWTTGHIGLRASSQAEQYLMALSKNGQPTAYLFQCRVCGAHLAYADAA
ncbi:CbrC family protein [Kitasatospora sp. Ki12]